MKRGKKIALIVIMVVVALAGTIGGVALAQSGDEDTTTTPDNTRFAYLERVCEIYQEKTGVAIDVDTLKDAICQAGDEYREQARNQFWQRLIDEGIITEEQLNEWQEWLQAKPDDLPGILGNGIRSGNRLAFRYGFAFGKGFGEGLGGLCLDNNSTD
jgi:ABC-type glycerol-3-phosphate transport system substrate-binding protein